MKRPTNWVPLETVASIAQEPNPPTEEQFYWLQVARMQLSPEEADLLTLRYDQDLPLEQISQELSLSVSAVKMRLKRCRDKLRGQLKTYAID
jgi:RNA polymerase sigma-70 factor (ECF subfamily)